jgi:alpha-glucosidase
VSDGPWTRWWESAVIYQLYPRSFQDSDGDGIGDLQGIIARLDHLVWLGIDAIWLSPVFRSPMADFGYDISDYRDVDPIFGTLGDLDRLIDRAHEAGLRIILDFVPNHSSSEHPWFVESRASRESPKRDWYLWADGRPEGGPPTNWRSHFGGSGWTWDERTGQYYFHSFHPDQPDLNWRNPAVRDAMHDVLRFWLDRGIDGFRVDVIWLLIKDEELRDNPPVPDATGDAFAYEELVPSYTADRPEVHELIAGMRAVLDDYGERVLIGEIYLPVERLVAYYGELPGRPGAHLPFNFQLIELPWRADVIAEAVMGYEDALPPHGWPNWVLGNHDRPRIASRVGYRQARVAAMLLLTLRGTPTIYYGDEIGMLDVPIPAELQRDPARFHGASGGRDPERTPMRWDASPGAGFTDATPWLPIGEIGAIDVADQRRDPRSMLHLHRQLLALRRREPALASGGWAPIGVSGSVLAYERSVPGRRLLIALELGGQPADLALDSLADARVLLSTELDRTGELVSGMLSLRADEGVILEVVSSPPPAAQVERTAEA